VTGPRPAESLTGGAGAGIDVHQHLWPSELVDELRRRESGPRLEEWTLRLPGEPDYQVDPADHDPARRAALAAAEGTGLALISLSSPLGIEHLPAAEAQPLLDAYHAGAARLGAPFGAWAAASVDAPRPGELGRLLADGFHGLQLPATALADADGYQNCAALLDTLVRHDRPLLIHPGPAPAAEAPNAEPSSTSIPVPGWWPAMVPYVAQMHAAWFAFRVYGRPAHPNLRVCFAMLAGLAPLHGERAAKRGAAEDGLGHDPGVWLEVSSYGPAAIGAVAAACGTAALIRGSDQPYAAVPEYGFGCAAARQLDMENPARLLGLPASAPAS
jgi:6-methylsalicylate decarboxylase